MSEVFMVSDNHLIALLIFLVSFTGFICNCLVTFYTHTLATMSNPFGRLSACQAAGEACLCAVFAFYYSPMVMFNIEIMKKYSAHAGWINLIVYDVCIWSHLFISLNRLSAICLPFSYDIIFSRSNTKMLMVLAWTIPIVTAISLYKLFPCNLYYLETYFAFVFTDNPTCNFISWSIDFYKDLSIVLVIASLDSITIFNVHQTTKELRLRNIQLYNSRQKEVNFLKQAVLQGIIFSIELLTYFWLAWQFDNKYITFALTTLAWNIVHCTDAIIILSFNLEFRNLLKTPFIKIRNVTSGIYNSRFNFSGSRTSQLNANNHQFTSMYRI